MYILLCHTLPCIALLCTAVFIGKDNVLARQLPEGGGTERDDSIAVMAIMIMMMMMKTTSFMLLCHTLPYIAIFCTAVPIGQQNNVLGQWPE